MGWQLQILGTNSALPTIDRFPSAQLLHLDQESCLIDCGEGAQIQIRRFGIRWMRINHIFISHMHGDHVFGLPGLITTFNLQGRSTPLTIYGPIGLRKFLEAILLSIDTELKYELRICEHDASVSVCILKSSEFEVWTIPLVHRIPTAGFLFKEQLPPRKLIGEKLEELKIPFSERESLKYGTDWISASGGVFPNHELTVPNRLPYSYAYCSDTAYSEAIVPIIHGADILYHETTFMHELEEKAIKRGHSTTKQAAKIAKLAEVKLLVIGHFSSRYGNLQPLVEECLEIFPNSVLPEEGELITFH